MSRARLTCQLLLFGIIIPAVIGDDSDDNSTFCGQLKVFQQRWFAPAAVTLAAQRTANLSECIRQCCAVKGCNAITYTGFLSTTPSLGRAPSDTTASSNNNCIWFRCNASHDDDWQCGGTNAGGTSTVATSETNSAREGVLSILILNRTRKWEKTTTRATEKTLAPHKEEITEYLENTDETSESDDMTNLFPSFIEKTTSESNRQAFTAAATPPSEAVNDDDKRTAPKHGQTAEKHEENSELGLSDDNNHDKDKNIAHAKANDDWFTSRTAEVVSSSPTHHHIELSAEDLNTSDVASILPTSSEEADNNSNDLPSRTSPANTIELSDYEGNLVNNTIPMSTLHRPPNDPTSLWIFAVAIVGGVVFGGIILALISFYFCRNIQRARTHSAAFKNVPTATLHAFNPPHITATGASAAMHNS